MSLTRFFDRQSGRNGPVIGALQVITMNLDTAVVTNITTTREVHLPAGMAIKVTDVQVWCGTVTSDPSITIGTVAAGTQIVAAADLATGTQGLTIKTYTEAATGVISMTITTDTGDAIALPVSINIIGHVSHPPTSVLR